MPSGQGLSDAWLDAGGPAGAVSAIDVDGEAESVVVMHVASAMTAAGRIDRWYNINCSGLMDCPPPYGIGARSVTWQFLLRRVRMVLA